MTEMIITGIGTVFFTLWAGTFLWMALAGVEHLLGRGYWSPRTMGLLVTAVSTVGCWVVLWILEPSNPGTALPAMPWALAGGAMVGGLANSLRFEFLQARG